MTEKNKMWASKGRWVYWLAWLSIGGCLLIYNLGWENTFGEPFINTMSYLEFTSPKDQMTTGSDIKMSVTNISIDKRVIINKNASNYNESVYNIINPDKEILSNTVYSNQSEYIIQNHNKLINIKHFDIENNGNNNDTDNNDNIYTINHNTETYLKNDQSLFYDVKKVTFKNKNDVERTKKTIQKAKGKKRIVTKQILLIKNNSSAHLNWGLTASRRASGRTLLTEEEYQRIKKIHDIRRANVKKACQSFTIDKKVSTAGNLFYSFMSGGDVYKTGKTAYMPQTINSYSFEVDKVHHILYCWLYKVGTTAWNSMFAQLHNQTEILRDKTFYNMRGVLSIKNREELIEALSYYRFMMVRHPFERLLSAFRDRIEDTSHRSWQRESVGPKILRAFRPHLKVSEMKVDGKLTIIPTFNEFVQYLLKTSVESYDPHWKPYWRHCSPCVLEYNAIGTTNTQDDDIKFILEESGLAGKVDPKILHENSHHGRGNTLELLTKYYKTLDLVTLEALYRRYEVDFKLFDYKVQPLLEALYPGKNVTFKPRL